MASEQHISSPDGNRRRERMGEIVRFGVVGVAATAVQYVCYVLLLQWLSPHVANTVAYVVSFCFNYIASTRFTFRVKSNARRGVGFALSHVVNYLLQSLFLSLFLAIGLSETLAMVPVFAVCVPINFVLVRFFLKR